MISACSCRGRCRAGRPPVAGGARIGNRGGMLLPRAAFAQRVIAGHAYEAARERRPPLMATSREEVTIAEPAYSKAFMRGACPRRVGMAATADDPRPRNAASWLPLRRE